MPALAFMHRRLREALALRTRTVYGVLSILTFSLEAMLPSKQRCLPSRCVTPEGEGPSNSDKISRLIGHLGQNHKVTFNFVYKETLGVWLNTMVLDFIGLWQGSNDARIALLKVHS